MKISIPETEEMELNTLILDLNGTLTEGGVLVDGVNQKIKLIKEKGLKVILFSGDTRGVAQKIADELGTELTLTKNGKEKQAEALKLNPSTCVTIGNGLIDSLLFKEVKLAIGVIQKEGIHTACLKEADIITTSVIDALDLLLDEKSLIATLRP